MTSNPTSAQQPCRRRDAPLYRECPTCGYISAEHGLRRGRSAAAPHCDSPGDSRRSFPAERIRRIDERIRRYHADGEHEIVVILVATFLETLLEDMLARIMAAEGASVKLRAGVLDTQRSVGQRIGKLFPTLTGEQFEDAAEQGRAARSSPAGGVALRAERNAFIHDAAFEGQSASRCRSRPLPRRSDCSTRPTRSSCTSTTGSSPARSTAARTDSAQS